ERLQSVTVPSAAPVRNHLPSIDSTAARIVSWGPAKRFNSHPFARLQKRIVASRETEATVSPSDRATTSLIVPSCPDWTIGSILRSVVSDAVHFKAILGESKRTQTRESRLESSRLNRPSHHTRDSHLLETVHIYPRFWEQAQLFLIRG